MIFFKWKSIINTRIKLRRGEVVPMSFRLILWCLERSLNFLLVLYKWTTNGNAFSRILVFLPSHIPNTFFRLPTFLYQRDVKKKKKNLNSFILPFVQWFSILDTQYPTFISILDQQRSQWCNLSNCVYSWTSFGIATGTYSSGHWYHNRPSVHCDKYPSHRSFIILLWSSKSLDLSLGRSIWWWQLWSEYSGSTEGKEFSMQRFPHELHTH